MKQLSEQLKEFFAAGTFFKKIYFLSGLTICGVIVFGYLFIIRATTVPVTNTVLIEVQPSVPIISTIESIQLDIGFASFGSKIIIEGTAPPNSGVDIYIQKDDNVYYKGKTTSDSNGRWKLIIEELIPPGKYEVWIVATTNGYPDIPSEKKEFLVPELKAQIVVFNIVIVLIEKIRALPTIVMIIVILIGIFIVFILMQTILFLLLFILRELISSGRRIVKRTRRYLRRE